MSTFHSLLAILSFRGCAKHFYFTIVEGVPRPILHTLNDARRVTAIVNDSRLSPTENLKSGNDSH